MGEVIMNSGDPENNKKTTTTTPIITEPVSL